MKKEITAHLNFIFFPFQINGLYESLKDDNMKLKNEFTILRNENKDNWKMYHEKVGYFLYY